MRYLSVCSGIEAASVAWQSLGWKCVGLSEIEPFPRSVLEQRLGAQPVSWDHQFSPQSNLLPLFGDFTKIEAHHVGPVDLLIGGTPCQSFSIAGKRLGLDDPRGNLAIEFLALARRVRARWILWENVPGVLSSWSGEAPEPPDDAGEGWECEYDETGDFHAFLDLFRECGYRGCYRVLDAQYVRVAGHERAVPQRRRRVFVVGHLGDDARAIPVLFDRESLRGHPAPSRRSGQGNAGTAVTGAEGRGECRSHSGIDANSVHSADIAPTLNAHFGDKQGLEDQHIRGGAACSLPSVANTLTQRMHKGINTTLDEGQTLIPTTGAVFDVAYAIQERAVSENLANGPQGIGVQQDHAYTLEARNKVQAVAHALRADGFDASEDGTGRGTPIVPVQMPGSVAGTLKSCGGQSGMPNGAEEVDRLIPIAFPAEMSATQHATAVNLSPALSVKHTTAIAFDTTQIASPGNYSAPKPGDACHPLAAGQHPPAVAFDLRGRDGGAMPEGPHDTANMRAADGGSSRSYVAETWAVRRLTPTECERLQGFPDAWTAITYRGKPAADGPRYKALGNSMAVNCMLWLGQRIQMVEDIMKGIDDAA